MTFADFIEAAKAYGQLGWAVQEQLEGLLEDPDGSYNPNAINMIRQFGGTVSDCGVDTEPLEDALREYEALRA